MKKLLFIFLISACAKSPYPITATAIPFKNEQPFLVDLSTGQDMKPIKANSTIQITAELIPEKGWPVVVGNDTGYIYPKFVQ
jgi:hypothetical protein